MRQTFQQCPIFHFGYSKIFIPFISSGSNLHQFLTAYSLPSKGIRLFIPNFILIFFLTFPTKPKQYFSTNQIARMTNFDQQKTTRNFLYFLYFCINFIQFYVIFAAFYVIIATHCHFNVVNLYIYHCILVFLHSNVDS